MEYTFSSYLNMMKSLVDNGYHPIRFCDVTEDIYYPAIIRHDVDVDLQAASIMAELENRIGIKSTYFILVSSEYYNLFSGRNRESANKILNLGHEIGLHFDVTSYGKTLALSKIGEVLKNEIILLETGFGIKVESISWHIPRKDLLGVHLSITDELKIKNAYDPYFYNGYKYVSDSMFRWREPVEKYIQERTYRKLQILTHPIWYRDIQDMTDEEILDQNRKKRIKNGNEYLNTIKPGFS